MTMQADVERTKDRDRAREAYTPAVVVPDLADQLAKRVDHIAR